MSKNIIIDIRPLMGGKISGVEVYILNLLEELFKIDKKNSYYLFSNAFKNQKNSLPKFKQANVKYVQTRIPNKILNLGLFLFNRPRIDHLINKQLGIQNRYSVYLEPDLRPISLSKNIELITVVHDLSFLHFPEFFSTKSKFWYKLLNPIKKLISSDKIIAVSNFTALDLVKNRITQKEKITVIHQGIRQNFATKYNQPELEKIRIKYKLPKNYLLFLSTLEPRKNMKRLMEAFNEYKKHNHDDLKLVLAGKENPKIFAKFKLQQNPNIIFTGFIEEHEKSAIYQMAKAFIYPSIFEGFGLPLLEAMACSTPIIASNTSSMPEILRDSAILIDPKNTDSICAAIKQIQNPELIKTLKEKMAKRIKDFSWQKCAKETLELIESIL